MPKEDIANSPDYRQETLLDKMINEIKDPTTKDLAAQLRDNINVMESTPKHGKHTPEYKIVEDNKVYAKAELKASKLREELKTRAPEILKTFDNTRKTMTKQKTQQKQKEQSFKKQEAKQETSLNDFKSLLAKQTNNLKQCKKVDTFMNRLFNKNKITNAIQNYVTTQVKIDNALRADQSLGWNARKEMEKLENPPQKLQKAVEDYKQSLSKSLTSYQEKNTQQPTQEKKLYNLTQDASNRAKNSNLSSPSQSKPNPTR
ncbi:hypothetical protein [Enterococcus sp. C76]|uniref:hypothetical protein n=1 Tax=Enterococcus sp. C76 TaxID=3231334 RepID=UPI00349FDDC4